MKIAVVLFALALSAPAIASKSQAQTPELFAPGVINTHGDEYGPTFTPDGRSLYFVRRNSRRGDETIVVSTRDAAGEWSEPRVVSFSGRYFDKEPYLSPDGSMMFFASTRPDEPGGPRESFDIWAVARETDGWGEPHRLGDAVNAAGAYDNYPAVAANGNLYFGSEREGGHGRLDIYVSRFVDGEYTPAENLGPGINTEATDTDPYIAPDESFIIFTSSREGTLGAGDLYISFQRDGIWSEPFNLGPGINSEEFDYTPFVYEGILFFSRGWGDIYAVQFQRTRPAR